MLIIAITKYFQGQLSKQEEEIFWKRLISTPNELELLETYWLYLQYYCNKKV